MKTCTKCGIEKDLSQFHNDKKAKGGKRPECKECKNKARMERYNKNPERERALNNKSNAKPENKAKRAIYIKKWKQDNPDKVNADIDKRKTPIEIRKQKKLIRALNSKIRHIKHISKKKEQKREQKRAEYKDVYDQYNFNPDIPKEEWRDVLRCDGKYQISNHGRIRSNKSNKMLKPFITDYGYMRVKIYREGKGQNIPVHRLVGESFIENPHNKEQINHIDMNKTNNIVTNLEWCTQDENMRHRAAVNHCHSST